MATSSIPAAIDALLNTIGGLGAFSGVQIVDGWPGVNQQPELIAIAYGDEAVTGAQKAAYAGSGRRWEDFGIACLISIHVGGYENAEQKAARDRAFVLLNAIDTAIRPVAGMPAGSTLPDAGGAPTVLYGEITDVAYEATDGVDAPMGRFAQIRFTVQAKKVI